MIQYIFKYRINPYLNFVVLPGIDEDSFNYKKTADETFDSGSFNIINSDLKDIPVNTQIEITIDDNNTIETILAVVGTRERIQSRFIKGKELYDWNISILEATKQLTNERLQNIGISQPLEGTFVDVTTEDLETEVKSVKSGDAIYFDKILEPYGGYSARFYFNLNMTKPVSITKNNFNIGTGFKDFIPKFTRGGTYYNDRNPYKHPFYKTGTDDFYVNAVYKKSGKPLKAFENGPKLYSTLTVTDTIVYTEGAVTVEIRAAEEKYMFPLGPNDELVIINDDIGAPSFFTYELVFADKDYGSKLPPLDDSFTSIYDATEKVLLATDRPGYYTIDPLLKDELDAISCPETFLTGRNVFQALLEIGRTIEAIPYLKDWNVVSFFKLTSDSLEDFDEDINGSITVQDISENVTNAFSSVQNAILKTNDNERSRTTLWQSFTGSSYRKFDADSAIYTTDDNIYKIKSISINYKNKGPKDISDYVYEMTQYNCLSKVRSDTRNSIAFALYYEEGKNELKGFTTKLDETLNPAITHNAITNIIDIAYKGSDITKDSIEQDWHLNTLIKIEYIPIANVDLIQFRDDTLSFGNKYLNMEINQNTNMSSLEYVGKSISGQLDRIGNDTIIVNRSVRKQSDIKKLCNNYRVENDIYVLTEVAVSYMPNSFQVSYIFNKNFNRLKAFASIDQQRRFFKVDERAAIDRTININEFCVIGTSLKEYNKDGTIKDYVKPTDILINQSMIKDGIFNVMFKNKKPTEVQKVAYMKAFDRKGNNCQDAHKYLKLGTTTANAGILKSVGMQSFGRGLSFRFNNTNNYAAGTGIVKEGAFNFATEIPYSDGYGLIEDVELSFFDNIPSLTLEQARLLPFIETIPVSTNAVINTKKRMKVKKSGREVLNFNYQLHFIKNNPNLVITSDFANYNGIIGGNINSEKYSYSVAIIDKRITNSNNNISNTDYIKDNIDVTIVGDNSIIITDPNSLVGLMEDGKEYSLVLVVHRKLQRIDGLPVFIDTALISFNGLTKQNIIDPTVNKLYFNTANSLDSLVYER